MLGLRKPAPMAVEVVISVPRPTTIGFGRGGNWVVPSVLRQSPLRLGTRRGWPFSCTPWAPMPSVSRAQAVPAVWAGPAGRRAPHGFLLRCWGGMAGSGRERRDLVSVEGGRLRRHGVSACDQVHARAGFSRFGAGRQNPPQGGGGHTQDPATSCTARPSPSGAGRHPAARFSSRRRRQRGTRPRRYVARPARLAGA